jgi:hypothetical protein
MVPFRAAEATGTRLRNALVELGTPHSAPVTQTRASEFPVAISDVLRNGLLCALLRATECLPWFKFRKAKPEVIEFTVEEHEGNAADWDQACG